jgi:hypothetical protein
MIPLRVDKNLKELSGCAYYSRTSSAGQSVSIPGEVKPPGHLKQEQPLALRNHPPPGRARAEDEEMTATSHGRGSWKDSPKAKRIAATISLLLIAGLIAMLAVLLFAQ